MRRYPEGIAVPERLVQHALDNGQPLTREQLATVVSDYKCPKCKSIVVVRSGDWLRSRAR